MWPWPVSCGAPATDSLGTSACAASTPIGVLGVSPHCSPTRRFAVKRRTSASGDWNDDFRISSNSTTLRSSPSSGCSTNSCERDRIRGSCESMAEEDFRRSKSQDFPTKKGKQCGDSGTRPSRATTQVPSGVASNSESGDTGGSDWRGPAPGTARDPRAVTRFLSFPRRHVARCMGISSVDQTFGCLDSAPGCVSLMAETCNSLPFFLKLLPLGRGSGQMSYDA